MTNGEAIDLLDNLIGMIEDNQNSDYDTALKMAIKALEQEPTTNNDLGVDCIDRKEFIDWINTWDITPIIKRPLIRHIQGMSSVTPIRPKGHWINIDATHSRCDRCGALFEIASANGEVNYCPNCGADMREVDNGNDD